MTTDERHDLVVTAGHGRSSDNTQESAFELFHNRAGDAFVDVDVDGHRETHQVTSVAFRHWLRLELLERTGKAPSASALKRHIELAQATAVQTASPVREVHVRAGCANGRVYIDLAGDDWSAIEIGPDGWRIIHSSPVRFIRMPGMLSLPTPQSGGSIETLRALVNVHDESDFVLLVAWLLNALRNEGQHPVLVLSGGDGTAKSTLVSMVRALIDPGCMPLGGLPRNERELATQARQRYLQAFDNAPVLSRQISDALCRHSTGGNAHPVIINGIDDVVTRPDLADRCLFITCDSIPQERRRPDKDLWAEFDNAHAQIFGLLLDTISHGLRELPETRPDRLPRMADFAKWAIACEGAFWPTGTFLTAIDENRAEAVEKLIGTDPVASAVRQLAARRRRWQGTATELDGNLRAITGNLDTAPQGWPADPARLAKQLIQLAPSLSKVGIEVTFSKVGHGRTRLIAISVRSASEEVPAATQTNTPSSLSALSAAGRQELKATPEADPAAAPADAASHHAATLQPVVTGEQPRSADDADSADGRDDNDDNHAERGDETKDRTPRSDKRFELASHVTSGERSVPVYRRRKRGKAEQTPPHV